MFTYSIGLGTWHNSKKCKCDGCQQAKKRYITNYGVQDIKRFEKIKQE